MSNPLHSNIETLARWPRKLINGCQPPDDAEIACRGPADLLDACARSWSFPTSSWPLTTDHWPAISVRFILRTRVVGKKFIVRATSLRERCEWQMWSFLLQEFSFCWTLITPYAASTSTRWAPPPYSSSRDKCLVLTWRTPIRRYRVWANSCCTVCNSRRRRKFQRKSWAMRTIEPPETDYNFDEILTAVHVTMHALLTINALFPIWFNTTLWMHEMRWAKIPSDLSSKRQKLPISMSEAVVFRCIFSCSNFCFVAHFILA